MQKGMSGRIIEALSEADGLTPTERVLRKIMRSPKGVPLSSLSSGEEDLVVDLIERGYVTEIDEVLKVTPPGKNYMGQRDLLGILNTQGDVPRVNATEALGGMGSGGPNSEQSNINPADEQGIIEVELERLRDQGHHVTTLAELEELLDGARERIEHAKRTGKVFGGDAGPFETSGMQMYATEPSGGMAEGKK